MQQAFDCSVMSNYVIIMFSLYPVDTSTTVFSYSHAVQYHTILHSYVVGILATRMCFKIRLTNAFDR